MAHETLDPPTETLAVALGRDGRRGGHGPAALLSGEVLAERFHILGGLGQGGMGQVYEALDLELDQEIALKVIRPELACRPRVVKRFKREVRLARRVSHEHVCKIFDLEQHRDPEVPRGTPLFFLTMERIRGCTLASFLREGREVSPDEASSWLRQIVLALDAAHRSGVIHGDLKPSNVMLEEAGDGSLRIVVTDFGLSLGAEMLPTETYEPSVEKDARATAARDELQIAGTPAYLAPEQRRGAPASVATDLYAFGLVALQVLAGGRSPRENGESVENLLRQLAVTTPAELVAVIRSCLAERPEDRPRSARELVERLATPEELWALLARSRHRRHLLLLVALLTLVVALAFAALAFRVSWEASRARDMTRLSRAIQWMDDDPTLGALSLLEVETPTEEVETRMRQALGYSLARFQVRLPSPVHQLAVGPGGGLVAAASRGGAIYLWNPHFRVETEEAVQTLARDIRGVTWMRFDPSGHRLLVASQDGSARVWDLEKEEEPRVFAGHEGRLWRAHFDPEGRRIVTPGEDHLARIWPIDGGPPVVLEGHEHWVMDARFDRAGERVVTASRDGTVRVWNAVSGETLELLEGHGSWVFHAEFSPDGGRVVSASRDGTARLWDLRTGEARVLEGHTGTVEWAFFRSDGEQIVTSSQDGTVRTWSAEGESEQILTRSRSAAWATYAGDGHMILLRTRPELRLVPGAGQGATRRFDTLGDISAQGASPDGKWLATAQEADVRLWPTGTKPWGQVVAQVDSSHSSLAFDTKRQRLSVGAYDGIIHVMDPEGRSPTVLEGHRGEVHGLAFSPDGLQLASASRDDTARLWALDGSYPPIPLRGHEGSVLYVRYSPRGEWLVSGGFGPMLRFWRTESELGPGEERQIVAHPLGKGMVSALDLEPGRRLLAVSTYDLGLQIYDLPEDFRAETELGLLTEDRRHFRCLDFDDRGRWLSAITDRSTIVTWEVARLLEGDWTPHFEVEVGNTKARCGGLSPDGERLVFPTRGGSVWVVDLRSDARPIELLGHGRESHHAFFLDPDQVISSSLDGSLRRWQVDDRDPRRVLAETVRLCLEPEARQTLLLESEGESERRADDCRRRLATIAR